MADIETGYWTGRETVESPPSAAEYQSQPSSCRQGPRLRPSLYSNRRLQASRAHRLHGRPEFASPPSIFRTTAPTFFFHLWGSLWLLSVFLNIFARGAVLFLSFHVHSIENLAYVCYMWIMQMQNKQRVLYRGDERSESPGPGPGFSFQSSAVAWSLPPLFLSGWSCSNKQNHPA